MRGWLALSTCITTECRKRIVSLATVHQLTYESSCNYRACVTDAITVLTLTAARNNFSNMRRLVI